MILIIGNGRVARHLCHYFAHLERPVRQWARAINQPAELEEWAAQADRIIFAISDSELSSFIASHSFLLNKICMHCSGAVILEDVYTLHPLMCFTPDLYDIETYQQIPFIIEKEGLSFSELLPGVPNPHYAIPRDLKPLYHALCVSAGNFTTLLWQTCFKSFEEKFEMPHQALTPYLKQTVTNLISNPKGALTGPIARRDLETIDANINALNGHKLEKIYQQFVEDFV